MCSMCSYPAQRKTNIFGFLSLSSYFSVCLRIFLSVFVFLSQSSYFSLSVHIIFFPLYLYFSPCLRISFSVFVFFSLSSYFSFCLHIYVSVFIFLDRKLDLVFCVVWCWFFISMPNNNKMCNDIGVHFFVLRVMFVYHCTVLRFQNIEACLYTFFFHMVCALRPVFDLTLTNWKPIGNLFLVCFENNITHSNCSIWRQTVTCNAMGKCSKHRLMIQYRWILPFWCPKLKTLKCNITVNFLQSNQNEVVEPLFDMIKQHQMSMARNPQNNIFGPALEILCNWWWRRAKLPRWHHPQQMLPFAPAENRNKTAGSAKVTRDLTPSGPEPTNQDLGT